jgi:hypothetical protein
MMREKTVVILQSNYIPWKGYFDLMNAADQFVIFDEAQYTRRDWRNRNKIIVGGMPRWLTIPVEAKGQYLSAIRDIRISDTRWATKHWNAIQHAYAKAPEFQRYEPALAQAYQAAGALSHLSAINMLFLRLIAPILNIATPVVNCSSIPRTAETPTGRLVEICLALGATRYLSGPSARHYIDPQLFADAGVQLAYANYTGYRDYPQFSTALEHGVSIIDLLMQVGPDARHHLKSAAGSQGLSHGATAGK